MGIRFTTKKRQHDRKGAAVVEFAVVAPVLFMIVFGIIEFGRLLMVQQVLTNATREGARRGITESSTAAEVQTVVNNYLAGASVSGATVTVTPLELATLGLGDPVTVSISVPFNSVSWLSSPWFLGGTTLSAQSVMQAERLE